MILDAQPHTRTEQTGRQDCPPAVADAAFSGMQLNAVGPVSEITGQPLPKLKLQHGSDGFCRLVKPDSMSSSSGGHGADTPKGISRRIMAEIPPLRQPHFVDYHPGPERITRHDLRGEGYANLIPWNDLRQTIASAPREKQIRIWAPEFNILVHAGKVTFKAALIPDEYADDGTVIRYGPNPLGDSLARAEQNLEPEEALAFLRRTLENSDWNETVYLHERIGAASVDEFVERALALSDCVYFKPQTGCQGWNIFRCEARADGRYAIVTNSLAFFRGLKPHREDGLWSDLGELGTELKHRFWGNSEIVFNSAADAKRTIADVLKNLRGGFIAEEAIPFAPSPQGKMELRMIFTPDGDEGYRLLAHYAKLGGKRVAGNIARGAGADKSVHAIEKILAKRHPEIGRRERRLMAEKEFASCVEGCRQFLADLKHAGPHPEFSHALSDGMLARVPSLDVIPSWDNATGKLCWYLVELQHNERLGISGLRRADPDQWNALRREGRVYRTDEEYPRMNAWRIK